MAVPPGTTHAPQEHVLKSIPGSENASAEPAHPVSRPEERAEEREQPDVLHGVSETKAKTNAAV